MRLNNSAPELAERNRLEGRCTDEHEKMQGQQFERREWRRLKRNGAKTLVLGANSNGSSSPENGGAHLPRLKAAPPDGYLGPLAH